MAWAPGTGDGAPNEEVALALFRRRKLPSMEQLQQGGRVPVGPALLQDDSRECITDVPSELRATEEHCALAFTALVEHLQGQTAEDLEAAKVFVTPQAASYPTTPATSRSGTPAARRGSNPMGGVVDGGGGGGETRRKGHHRRGSAVKELASVMDSAPFYVRWEVPRYTSADVKRVMEALGPTPSARARRHAESIAHQVLIVRYRGAHRVCGLQRVDGTGCFGIACMCARAGRK